MQLSHLIFVTLFYQAVGFFLSFGAIRQSQVGSRYYLYHGLIAVATAGIGYWLLDPEHLTPALNWGFGIFVLSCTVFSFVAGKNERLANILYVIGLASSLFVIGSDLSSRFTEVRFYANSLLSTLLLGFSMAAMLLGHWYLIQPKLSISELRRTTLVLLALVLVRTFFTSWGVAEVLAGKSEGEIYRYLLMGDPGIFILMRWAWGILVPLILGVMVWKTVQIRSTQSATGILYVVVVCIITGEILSQYLTFYHGLPM